jgi:hypothetical protein
MAKINIERNGVSVAAGGKYIGEENNGNVAS